MSGNKGIVLGRRLAPAVNDQLSTVNTRVRMRQQITALMKRVSAGIAVASLAVLAGCSGGASTRR